MPPLTDRSAVVDAVPAWNVTLVFSQGCKSFKSKRWRRPLSKVTISTFADSFRGMSLISHRQSLVSGRDKAHSKSASPPLMESTLLSSWTMSMGLAVRNEKRNSGFTHISVLSTLE